MTARSTKDIYDGPHADELIVNPYPQVKRMRQRGTTTIQKETAS